MLNPEDANAYGIRGVFRYQMGDFDEGIADIKKAQELNLAQGNTIVAQHFSYLLKQLQQQLQLNL